MLINANLISTFFIILSSSLIISKTKFFVRTNFILENFFFRLIFFYRLLTFFFLFLIQDFYSKELTFFFRIVSIIRSNFENINNNRQNICLHKKINVRI